VSEKTVVYASENSRAIFRGGREPWRTRYCWRTYFNVPGLLFLA